MASMAVILIIEDDKDSCDMLARFLGRSGHTVVCARNGREAINLLTENNPQILLLDLTMPEMDGLSFLEVLRSYIRWSTLPVLLMTGVGDDAVLDKARNLGVRRSSARWSLSWRICFKRSINSPTQRRSKNEHTSGHTRRFSDSGMLNLAQYTG